MTRSAAVLRKEVHRALATFRAHPRHLVLMALVAGLVTGPRAPVVTVAFVLAVPVLAPQAAIQAAMVAAAVGGALLAQGRVVATAHTALDGQVGHAVMGRATLLELPRRGRFGQASALVRFERERVLLLGPAEALRAVPGVGGEIAVRGSLRASDGFARRRGASAVLHAQSMHPTGNRRRGLAGAIDRMRERAEQALAHGVPPREGALLQGMVLGDDHDLPEALVDDFRAAGLSHLTAASGQNVAVVAGLGWAVAAAIGLVFRLRLALVFLLIALYVPLAGAGPSIQRAGVMGAAAVVAAMAGRPASRWYGLGLAAAATLLLDPRVAEDPGWQMSFAAVVGIMAVGGRWRDALVRRGAPPGIAAAAALTGAAGLATAPIVAWHFGRASLVAPLANLLAVPAVAPVMWLGMVAASIGQADPGVAAPVTAVAGIPAAYITWVAHATASLPAATVAAPVWAVTGAVVGLLACALSRRARGLAAAAAALALVAWLAPGLGVNSTAPPPDHLRVSFLDVGQGDATLVQDGDSTLLVDTGPPGGGVLDGLRRSGVTHLDALVVTHAQADHAGGARAVLGSLPVRVLVDGRDGVRTGAGDRLAAAAVRRHVRLMRAEAGQVLQVGRLQVDVLWPPGEPSSAQAEADPNDRAIVALVRDRGARVLLTADVESDVLASRDLPAVDILKVAHHGSADPGLPALLDRIRPAVAVISVGASNEYRHPVPSTLRALEATVPAVYRTDRDGTVRVDVEGGRLHADTERSVIPGSPGAGSGGKVHAAREDLKGSA